MTDLLRRGYWLGNINFCIVFAADVFLSFREMKMAAPGLSIQAFVKMLQKRTVRFGRNSGREAGNEETVSCFIHSVSPVKFSANSVEFFNVVLQTGRVDFHDTVVFSPGKRHAFLQAERNGTLLCLKNVKKALSSSP
ncbi:hypothetical protein SRHO_G00028710 [Serrasalmus rhombeus]